MQDTVTSKNLTVVDTSISEDAFSSRRFDDEGCPSQDTVLIKDGILNSYLTDATSAQALKTCNTGNASRYSGGLDLFRSVVGYGYKATPEVYPSNSVISLGTKIRDELISEVEKGVLAESMAEFAQQGSAKISAQLSEAFVIQKGGESTKSTYTLFMCRELPQFAYFQATFCPRGTENYLFLDY